MIGLKKTVIKFVEIIIFSYAITASFLFLFQRRLIYPAYLSKEVKAELNYIDKAEKIILTTEDNIKLYGYLYKPSDKKSVILYFHGNGDSVETITYKANMFNKLGYGFFCASYRGYGKNSGKPSEQGIYLDAKAQYEYLLKQGVKPQNIILYGHSLGTGVAVELASKHKNAALILEAPYSSVLDVAKSKFKFFPVSLLLRDKFLSIDKIRKVQIPKLFLHGSKDKVIDIAFGKKLYDTATGDKSFYEFSEGNHINLLSPKIGGFQKTINWLKAIGL